MAQLLQLALALLLAAQGPNVPQDLKIQAISIATYAIQVSTPSPIGEPSVGLAPAAVNQEPAANTCEPSLEITQGTTITSSWNTPNSQIEKFRMSGKVNCPGNWKIHYSGMYSFDGNTAPVFDYGNSDESQTITFLNPIAGTYTVDFVARNPDTGVQTATTSVSFTSHGVLTQ